MRFDRLVCAACGAALLFLVGSCSGVSGPLSGCGTWTVDADLADSTLAEYEFANQGRSKSREEIVDVVVELVAQQKGLSDIEVLIDDTESVAPELLPEFSKATVGDGKPFPPKPDWLVLGSDNTRWVMVLHDDAATNAPLDARLDEGWYVLGDVSTATCN